MLKTEQGGIKNMLVFVVRIFVYIGVFLLAAIFYGVQNVFFTHVHFYILMMIVFVMVIVTNGGMSCFLDGIFCCFRSRGISSNKIKKAIKLYEGIRGSLYMVSVLNLLLGLLAAYVNKSFEGSDVRFVNTMMAALPITIIGIFVGACVISPFIHFMKDRAMTFD